MGSDDRKWAKKLIAGIAAAKSKALRDRKSTAEYWNGDSFGSISGVSDAQEWVDGQVVDFVLKNATKAEAMTTPKPNESQPTIIDRLAATRDRLVQAGDHDGAMAVRDAMEKLRLPARCDRCGAAAPDAAMPLCEKCEAVVSKPHGGPHDEAADKWAAERGHRVTGWRDFKDGDTIIGGYLVTPDGWTKHPVPVSYNGGPAYIVEPLPVEPLPAEPVAHVAAPVSHGGPHDAEAEKTCCRGWATDDVRADLLGNGHHHRCEHYQPNIGAVALLGELVNGIDSWASHEDGVPEELWDAYSNAHFIARGSLPKGMEGQMKPRAYTEEEVREMFLSHIRSLADYWSKVPGRTTREALDGLAFSILNIFDGTTMDLPSMDIHLSPHEDDKEYHRKLGENWFEPEMLLNGCMLHEMYYRKDSR